MSDLKKYILYQLQNGSITKDEAVKYIGELQQKKESSSDSIAIIGVSCRMPMADNAEMFWDNIINERNCFSAKPIEKLLLGKPLANPHYAEFLGLSPYEDEAENLEMFIGAYIKDIDKFDANFFGIPPREAKFIDPGQRVFLEEAWKAIEDAGYSAEKLKGSRTGVFVGKDNSNSIFYKYIVEPDQMSTTGNWEGILASRISYLFNFRGPAIVVDTACSSGLVAIHEACCSLRSRESDMCLAGGIAIGAGSVTTNEDEDDIMCAVDTGSALDSVRSKDNKVRTFDKKCSGTVFGEGVVVFSLKRMEDAIKDGDNIYALIKGSAINNDGTSNGITAPNPAAQEDVIREAWKKAAIDPQNISYVETHGTGTLLGDPIEVIGLTNAFKHYTKRRQFCGLGSVKTNIGHTVAASGTASLLKVVMAMKNGMLPASIYFEEPNPNINFIDSPVYVVDKPSVWSDPDKPLLAGVNAFGFSGTNCHVVVEEFKQKYESGKNNNEIITISGKTENSAMKIAGSYLEFVRKNECDDLHRLAYTAKTGRGHYEYRIAVISDSMNNLKKQLEYIIENGFSTCKEYGIYCGVHRIVSDRRQHKETGDVTESEYYNITEKAKILLDSIKSSGEESVRNSELCELYIKGANIKWNILYTGQNIIKMHLPPYPFERTRYWGELRQSKIEEHGSEKSDYRYPYLVRCLADSMKEKIYLLRFSVEKDWVLKEHKIFNTNVVPGTAYLEVCREVFIECFGENDILIENIMFFDALTVSEEKGQVDVHFIVNLTGEGMAEFTVASRRPDDKGDYIWSQHAQGRAVVNEKKAESQPHLCELLENGKVTEIKMELQDEEQNSKSTVYLGPRWNSFEHIYKIKHEDEEYLCAEMNLDAKYESDIKQFLYHPGLTDAALNLPLQIYVDHDIYLPYSYKNLNIYRRIPKHFYSKVKRIGGQNGADVMIFDAMFVDMDGNLIASIDEYAVKKVNRFQNYNAVKFHQVVWQRHLEEHDPVPLYVPSQTALIFADGAGISHKLSEQICAPDVRLCRIDYGDEYRKVNETHYIITGKSEDYDQLLQDIGTDKITSVFHLSTCMGGSFQVNLETSEKYLNRGLYSLLFLTQAALKRINHEIVFYLLSDCAHSVISDDVVNPYNTSFLALAKTLKYECPKYRFVCVDTDLTRENGDVISSQLGAASAYFRTAFRGNNMYTEVLEEVSMADREEIAVNGKNEGVYVITGGTGGLGLEAADYLSWNGCGNICILGRTILPVREEWDAVLERNENVKICRLIKQINKIEEKGNKIIVRNADITDYAAMKNIFRELETEYGTINGMIHCAGVAGDGILLNKPFDVFCNVIGPKITGSIILSELTKEHKPDFYIMYSSIQTIFGGIGQGDYTAANAFMDGYAQYLRTRNMNAQTINWSGWSETGMAVDYRVNDDAVLFSSVDNAQGIKGLYSVMTHNVTNVVPGDINYKFMYAVSPDNLPFAISNQIRRVYNRTAKKLRESGEAEHSALNGKAKLNADEIAVLGKEASEYTEIEKAVAIIYASVLDLEEIDIYESFNALGGDSIIATEVFKILDKNFPGILNISDVFSYSTVEDMSAHIDSIMKLDKKEKNDENYSDMMEKLDTGEIEVDSMIEFFENQGVN